MCNVELRTRCPIFRMARTKTEDNGDAEAQGSHAHLGNTRGLANAGVKLQTRGESGTLRPFRAYGDQPTVHVHQPVHQRRSGRDGYLSRPVTIH